METLTGLVAAALRENADAVFLECPGQRSWTYRQIDTLANSLAHRLLAAGAGPGERMLVQVEKSAEAVALFLACLRTGAIYVPLNPAYTETEVAALAADCEPAVSVRQPGRPDVAEAVSLSLGREGTGTLLEGLAGEGTVAWPSAHPDDIAAMLYTSGTTGPAKGALLSQRALAINALTLIDAWGISGDDVLVHPLPIFHTHGLFVALDTMLLTGATVRLMERFDADVTLGALSGATVMMGVPTHYLRLMASRRLDRAAVRDVRLFISGSAPLSSDASDRFHALTGHRILERYGMTEAGMIASNPLHGERVAGTVGFPLDGYEARVRGNNGEPAAPDEPGVLEIRGPHLFSGYWRAPDKTAEAHTEDGFFVTGDVVTQSRNGRITIVGRSSDTIITGGLNVYPREVEQVLDDVSGVVETAVIGLPDDDLGEIVAAFVVADAAVSEQAMRDAAGDQLASFKRPRRYVFVEELPRNATGKVQRAMLRV